MKRFTRIGLFLFFCLVQIGTKADGATISSIINTQHDLSSTSTATIRASSMGTDEICSFCHTPHSARKDAPLWNRTDVKGPYTAYASDVMSALTIAGEDPSSKLASGYNAHVKSRICLSCHDGTIALGNLVNFPNGFSSNIPMQGTGIDGQGRMISTAAGYMGVDLSDDHPVAVVQNTTKDQELIAPTGKIWLYDGATAAKTQVATGASAGYVECTSCHNAHDNQWGNFLVSGNDQSKLCLGCHTKVGYSGSVHDTTTVSYAPPSGAKTPNPTTLGSNVGQVKCMDCHFPHKAGITDTSTQPPANPASGKYLLSFQEDMSCFNNPNRWNSAVTACHGSNGKGVANKDIDIQTQVNKGYPTMAGHSAIRNGNINAGYTNKHGSLEQGSSGSAKYGTITNHVVCSDCHNAHSAASTNHAQGTNAIALTSPLYGSAGVSFAGSLSAWAVPGASNYNAYEPLGATTSSSWASKYEYEICFKCHTSFAWGAGSPPSIYDLTNIPNMTDQLQEFNPSNPSYHTVMAGLSASSYATPAASFGGGWTNAVRMYCSDCHGNNTTVSEPQGPHGSTNPGILVLPFSDTYGTAGGAAQPSALNADLCYKCHAVAVYGNPGLNTPNGTSTGFSSTGNINLHTQHAYRERVGFTTVSNPLSYKCVNCHTRVAHGWKRRGLVVFQSDGAGYEAGGVGTGLILNTSSIPASPGANQYGTTAGSNCFTVNGCHQ